MPDESQVILFLENALSEMMRTIDTSFHTWESAKFIRTSETSWNIGVSRRPDWMQFYTEILNLRAFKLFSNVIADDPTRSQHNARLSKKFGAADWLYLQPDQVALFVLLEYLNNCDQLRLELALATTISKSFCDSWKSGVAQVLCFSIVQGVFGKIERTEIAPDIFIRCLRACFEKS